MTPDAPRSRLETRLRGRLARVDLIREVAEAANEAQTLEEVLGRTMQLLCHYLGWSVGYAYRIDGKGRIVDTGPRYVDDPSWSAALGRATNEAVDCPEGCLIGDVVRTGRPRWIPDVREDPGIRRRIPADIPLKSGFAFPVRGGDDVAAVLECYTSVAEPRDPHLFELLEILGRELGQVALRERAQRALEVLQARFEGIVDRTRDAILVIDEGLRIVEFNRGAEEILEVAREEVLGRSLVELFLPTRWEPIYRRFLRSVLRGDRTGDSSLLHRVRILRGGGTEFSAEASVSRIPLEEGVLLSILLRDVSVRERLERTQVVLAEAGDVFARSLELSETVRAIARVAVKHLADWCIVYLVEGDGTVSREAVVGRDPDEGDRAEALRGGPLPNGPAYPVARVLETGEPQVVPRAPESSFVFENPRDGRPETWSLDATSYLLVPLRIGDRVTGAVAFISTDPGRRYESDDLGLAQELARRTALALENSRLYEVTRRAVRTRDEVLGMVSHDLGTPVSSMIMVLDRLLRRIPPEDDRRSSRHHLDAMRGSVEQMRRLIEDLLDVRSIESGHFTCEPRPQTLATLLELARTQLTPVAEEHGIDLEMRLPPPDLRVEADPDRVIQVLSNLVTNAFRYSCRDEPVVVSAVPEHDRVRISVADQGSGIPPSDLPTLFDRFAQARRTHRAGAGLGLTIAREIVEAHGGDIGVETEVGVGSTFHFTLPLVPEARAEGQQGQGREAERPREQ